MKHRILAAAALAAIPLMSACTTTPPVEVTRFHLPDTTMLGRGPISVQAGPGMDANALEFRNYSAAVAQQLGAIGYTPQQGAAPGAQVAEVRFARSTLQAMRNNSPVSVGVGGATGSYGGGVGLGIGIDLSGPPANQVATELSVTIRDRAGGKSLWEGRAVQMVSEKSALASPQASAQKLATALFQGFPGNSGETITVK
jgi:hypothetical protein